ncbi:MAG: type II secretion system protein GspM [Candidatus Binatia bacterium]
MSNFWNRLSKRERTLVVATVLILLAFAAKYAVLSPFLERREWVKNQLDSQPQLLAKNLRYVTQKDALHNALQGMRAQVKAQEPKFLSGDTPSVTASDLQDTVQSIATREGAQVITTRVLNPEPAGLFSKIGIQLEIGGQIQQIANLIKALESSPKLLVIDEITVRSLFRPIGFPQPQGAPQLPAQNLRVSLTVVGFARAPEGGSPKAGASRGQTNTSAEGGA